MDLNKTDSVVNLTQPELYSIYNRSQVDLQNDLSDSEIYDALPSNIKRQHDEQQKTRDDEAKNAPGSTVAQVAMKLAVLGVVGVIYKELAKHIHDNHILTLDLAVQPLIIGNNIILAMLSHLHIPDSIELSFVITFLEGIVLGLVQPIADRFLPPSFSSNKNSNLTGNDILRASLALLGVSFGVRKIEWNSSLQVSLIWSLLNPCLWLLLDGTISGFLTSGITAFGCSLLVFGFNPIILNYQDPNDLLAVGLWLASFFFCGLIIFGKIGRFLFA